MVARTFLLAALLCGACAGCQHQRMRESYIVDAFSAEARILEDKLYELNDRIDDLEARLESRTSSGSGYRNDTPPPSNRSRRPPDVEEPDLTPPDIVPGSPTSPGGLPSPRRSNDEGAAMEFEAEIEMPADAHIAQVRLNGQTRTVDFDDRPGDDGLWVVVQPQNRDGQFVPLGGPVTVVLLDAATRSHVGRWEFDAASVENAIRVREDTPGIFLKVQWNDPPRGTDMHVFVRYQTEDGRKLEANLPVTAHLEHHVAERWTPRPATETSPPSSPRMANQPGSADRPPQGPPPDVYR